MRNFGEHHKQLRFKIANGLITDEGAIKSLMEYRSYSRDTAEKCLRGMKKGIERDRKLKKEKDMRTKGNRATKTSEDLTVEQIKQNYEERGRLLKGEVERLFELMQRPVEVASSPLDAFVYPTEDVFEEMDNEQIVTLSVALGMMMLMLIDRHLPEHSRLKRQGSIKDVEKAIMTLAKGLGKPISDKALTYWSKVWNLTWNMAMDKIKKDHNIED